VCVLNKHLFCLLAKAKASLSWQPYDDDSSSNNNVQGDRVPVQPELVQGQRCWHAKSCQSLSAKKGAKEAKAISYEK